MKEWRHSLLNQKGELLQLMNDIERDFLGLGQSMKEMSRPVRELRGCCEKVVTIACGESGGHAVQFSMELLKKSEGLAEASQGQFEDVVSFFSELKKRLVDVTDQQDNLVRTLRALPCIIIHVKLQSSTLDPATRETFAALIVEIQGIMHKLGNAVERQLEEIKRIAKAEITISQLISSLSEKVMQHKREVSSHLDGCRSNLEQIERSLRNSGGMIEEISVESKSIGRHSSNVVVSLQCQDRVRQKVEHVGAAMEEMVAHLGQFLETSMTEPERQEAKLYLKEAASIQLKQVGRIMDELKSSANGISLGIDGIEGGASQISQKALLTAECSFSEDLVQQVSSDINKIISMIRVTVEGVQEIRAAVAPFEAGFANSAGEIRSLALDIRFVSLNAQIYAEHFKEGRALSVLSNSLREVSDCAFDIVSIIFNHIENLREMMMTLNRRLADFDAVASKEKAFLEQESLVSTQKLEESYRELKSLINQISIGQKEIDRIRHHTAERLRFPELVETSSQKAVRYFEKLISWGRHGWETADIVRVVALRIQQLKKNYTMVDELDVHERVHEPTSVGRPSEGVPMPLENKNGMETVPIFDRLSQSKAAGATGDAILFDEDSLVPAEVGAIEASTAAEELGNNVELF